MSPIISGDGALAALYAGNGLWFTRWVITKSSDNKRKAKVLVKSALIHFGFRQKLMMRKLSKREASSDPMVRSLREGDKWHHDIMSYLGGINSAPALLAFLRLLAIWKSPRFLSTGTKDGDLKLDFIALLVLGMANFSQAFLNFTTSRKCGRWIMGRGFDRITVLDALFTVLDWGGAILKIRLVQTV
ncbi:uncharacterized protein LDX57_010822 [Aspergillus melleus]|uniref:uncharacterized protein n=1 Tax=Aspergillus melleus TaxID=138277 RepID=UPI001E8DD4B8|nr:uncharacterized protein LDX57_010822 [Aspergillus melleus]KAH8433189.1 hypothetical protein LDX57_010822 [Aspergillus melleus]